MQKYKAIKTEYGYLIIKDKKSNNYLTALYYDGKEVVASSHEIYSRLPSFDVPEEWEEPMDYRYYNGNIDAYEQQCFDFKDGYNAAKEKYKWTDEDMEKMFELGNLNRGIHFKYLLNSIKQPKEYEVDIEFVNNKVIIKSWK